MRDVSGSNAGRGSARLECFEVRVSLAEEASLAPSLLVAVAGCNHGCLFCNAHWQQAPREELSPEALARYAAFGREQGARTLQLTGGEPARDPAALGALLRKPLALPVVLNTNLSADLAAWPHLLARLAGVVVSARFGSQACGLRLAGTDANGEGFWTRLERLLATGIPVTVRHLVLPGHVACCSLPVLSRLATLRPRPALTVLAGYMPPAAAPAAPELLRFVRDDEWGAVTTRAQALGLAPEVCGQALVTPSVPPSARPSVPAVEPLHRVREVVIDGTGRVSCNSPDAGMVALLESLTSVPAKEAL